MSHMPTASLHIGALSTRTGHSIHAIRWYEAQGLACGATAAAGVCTPRATSRGCS